MLSAHQIALQTVQDSCPPVLHCADNKQGKYLFFRCLYKLDHYRPDPAVQICSLHGFNPGLTVLSRGMAG